MGAAVRGKYQMSERIVETEESSARRVLLVDDHADTRFALESVLRIYDFEVHAVGSGEAALDALLESTFSLMVTDLRMPGISGRELIELIRGHPRHRQMPILLMTASCEQLDLGPASECGTAILRKPFAEHALIAQVNTLLLRPTGIGAAI
jgi:CheY-like chemotaxis protein